MSEKDAPKCNNGAYYCGVHWDCGKCKDEMRRAAYARLTPEEKAYDDMVDPLMAYHSNYDRGCSCHILPPCSYCVNKTDQDN